VPAGSGSQASSPEAELRTRSGMVDLDRRRPIKPPLKSSPARAGIEQVTLRQLLD